MAGEMKKPQRRYSKSMADIFAIKKRFFDENDTLLCQNERFAEMYRAQPKRNVCKVCETPIAPVVFFINRGTNYHLCDNCGHLNGEFDDSETLSNALYTTGLYGGDYQEPTQEGYYRRMDSIYIPKARFLKDSLELIGADFNALSYLDVGAGAGYMIGALLRSGDAARLDAMGIEIDEYQVAFANKMLQRQAVELLQSREITEAIRETNRDVLTFINVLEHITNLKETLSAIRGNRNIKYVFFCVPLLSITCAFEIVFPEVYARHIGGGGHTHLFSENSLSWIYENYGFTPLAEWRFGADVMDFFRSMSVMLGKHGANEGFIQLVGDMFQENADAIQQIVDRSGMASDIHVLLKVH